MTQPLFSHPSSLKIFGPAGSGKTRELIRILQEHVAEGDFALRDGIIVSFTRAAAYDIAKRVNPDGEPGKYHCTLHALCKRYYGFDGEIAEARLREFFRAEHIPFTGGPVGDGEEWAPTSDWRPSEGATIVSFFSQQRNRLLSIPEARKIIRPPDDHVRWWQPGAFERIWGRYAAWKDENRLVDFTDMLEHAALDPPRMRFAFFVMDECQDATPLQWQVAQAFAAQAEVAYLGGDDDQAIYSWAGATPHEFLSAETGAEDVLHVNHRSGAVIVDAAQQFIRQNRDRKEKDMRAAHEGGEISRSYYVPELDPAQSTMIMARAHYLTTPLMDELTRRGYPFVDVRGSQGVGGGAATAYGRLRRLRAGERLTLDEWRLTVAGIPSAGPWLIRGTKKRLHAIDSRTRAGTYVRACDIGAYGATEDLVAAIKAGATDPLGRVHRDRLKYLRGVADRYGPEYLDESKARATCVAGPIHAFKGLEADHVIIHEGMPPAATREVHRDPEPERRVFYVAMTRAKDRITWVNGPAFANFREVL